MSLPLGWRSSFTTPSPVIGWFVIRENRRASLVTHCIAPGIAYRNSQKGKTVCSAEIYPTVLSTECIYMCVSVSIIVTVNYVRD